MSLFDFIENEPDQAPEPTIPTRQPSRGSSKPDHQATTGQRPWKQKPERLKFLKPCPICQGNEFTHGNNGGFFCNHCQPGIKGHPVIALGCRQPPETVEGLPCGGCGATLYTKIENGFIFDDGSLADGWHCGGMNCPVKILIGNKKVDQATIKKTLGGSSQDKNLTSESHEQKRSEVQKKQ